MFVLANLLIAVGYFLRVLVNFGLFFILTTNVIKWIPFLSEYASQSSAFQQVSQYATILETPLRGVIKSSGTLDLVPIITVALLVFVDKFLVQSLIEFGRLKKEGRIY